MVSYTNNADHFGGATNNQRRIIGDVNRRRPSGETDGRTDADSVAINHDAKRPGRAGGDRQADRRTGTYAGGHPAKQSIRNLAVETRRLEQARAWNRDRRRQIAVISLRRA